MKFGRLIRAGLGPVLDVVVPDGCWADGKGEVTYGLAEDVREEIGTLAAQGYCVHCGLTVGPFEVHDWRDPCGRCGEKDIGVKRTARVGTFSEPLIRLVHRLKFGRSWEVAGVLAPFMYQALLRVWEREGGQGEGVLVPVPLHWSRRARRGFNQAEELAREVGTLSGWKTANLLWRQKRTKEQARIDAPTKRAENLRGAFGCRRGAGGKIAGKHIWLVDDVTTTGATLHAAASALRRLPKREKPASINALVVCVTDHKSPPAKPLT